MSQDKPPSSATPRQPYGQDATRETTRPDDNVVFLSERDRDITKLRQQYLQGKLKIDSRRVAEKLASHEAELDDIHS